jgi:Flp pilus assembly protein TadG
MRRHQAGREAGVAALELGLLMSVLFMVLGLVFPLGAAFIEKHRLDRTVADSIRFASATPNTPASDADARRPTAAAVQSATTRTYVADGGSTDGFSVDVVTSSVPGGTVHVTVHKKVDLGPLGSFLHSMGWMNSTSITVSSSATGREE